MNKPQFPFQGGYAVTQGYADNANHYPEGHHGAWDIVPLKKSGAWPAPIFPLYDGSEIAIQNSDPAKGKGVRERVLLDNHFINYLQNNNCLNGSSWPIVDGKFWLDILYWHMLNVTDTDGTADTNMQLGLAGNTGDVYSQGSPVPNYQKGKPPYPGLHLHLETSIYCESNVFVGYMNRDKDPAGRIDPQIIFNYQGNMIICFKKQGNPTYYVQVGTVLVPLADPQALTNIGGSLADVIELNEQQFSLFTVGDNTLFKSK